MNLHVCVGVTDNLCCLSYSFYVHCLSLVLVAFVKASHVSASHNTSFCEIHAYHRMFDGYTLYEVLNYFNDKFCNPKNIYNPKNIKFYMYACAFIFIVSSLGC